MKRDLKKNLLLLFVVYWIPKTKPKHGNSMTVHGITGENVTAKFTFEDPDISSLHNKPSLYKNDKKIGSCKQTSKHCSERFVLSDVIDNSTATLFIINITLDDEGKYHVVVLDNGANSLIFSNKIYFMVKPQNKTNENRSTSVPEIIVNDTPKLESSAQTFIYISALAILFICLFMGLLCWFYRTCSRKPARDNPQAQSKDTTQGDCGRSGAVSVSCVEYGELDFQNRPTRDDRVKPVKVTSKDQDNVEYATIIFPQHKQTPGGRMRDKQRAYPVTR